MSELQEGTQEVQETAVAAKPVVRISDCKRMLKEGMTRKEIAAHYGYPMSVMAEKVWSLPELKGLKTKKIYDIEIVNDLVSETTSDVTEEVTNDTAVENVEEVETTTESNNAFTNMQAEIGEEVAPSPVSEWGNH